MRVFWAVMFGFWIMTIVTLKADITVSMPNGSKAIVPLDTEQKCYRYGGLWTIERNERNETIIYCDMKHSMSF